MTLPPRQQLLLEMISDFSKEHSYAPSIRELMGMLGVASTKGIHDHLEALAKKGAITRDARIARSTVLTQLGHKLVTRRRAA